MENNDLISRSALIAEFDAKCMGGCGNCEYAGDEYFRCKLLETVPAVDAEIIRHGRWIPNKVGAVETKFECSECGRTVILGNDYFAKATEYASHSFPYCHCGAKMDGDVDVGK